MNNVAKDSAQVSLGCAVRMLNEGAGLLLLNTPPEQAERIRGLHQAAVKALELLSEMNAVLTDAPAEENT